MLVYMSVALALIGYAVLCYGIMFRGASQALSATLLWLILDGIAAWTAYVSGGNYLLAAGYTVGCLAAATVSIAKGKTSFQKSDIWVAIMVAICVVVWQIVGNIAGLVASSLAVFIAGFPAILHYAKFPGEGQKSVWVIYTLANACGLIGGMAAGITIENMVFPVFAIASSGAILWMLIRKSQLN